MDLPIVYHPNYVAPLPAGHRFPMPKFGLLRDQLIADRVATIDQFHAPEPPPQDWFELVHDPDYVDAYCNGTLDTKAQRRIGLPWSAGLALRTQTAIAGSILTTKLAIEHGLACNTAGGTHHAFPSFGSGFCIFNDLAIATKLVQQQNLAQRVLIVDLDVHQGDGTAFIFNAINQAQASLTNETNNWVKDARKTEVFTFSMHCQDNFPHRKQTSHLDVPLPVGMEDEDYLRTLASYLPDLLDQFKPDLVLYDAGVDTHIGDRLGKLALTNTGLFRREMQVLSTCVGQGYPVACVIGGGYAEDMRALVYRHTLLHRAASEVYHQYRL
ncbi:Histone deacetylase [Thalassoporum mexicanum PCC 7367]|uniref:histone deacetylase family protein n=1 Tax=Thalassoporum mexicanum TaxID=3457544 RepID=UPI00029FA667|nr:histone deacetylase [Pseudanabaena sp. PCC 7367]AFY70724.1 Histone deacetylase [Pseudanabaena sp. PCC 7367]